MPRRAAPRLQDIAAEAGVSVTTVSRILNNRRAEEFSDDTRERITRLARDMDWRPNLIGRGMKSGRTDICGVFMAPYDVYWTGVLYGVHDTLLASDHVPIVSWPHALVHPTFDAEGHLEDRTGAMRGRRTPDADRSDADLEELDVKPPRHELQRLHRLEDQRVDAVICWPLQDADARERLTVLADRGWRIIQIDDDLPPEVDCITIGSDEDAAMTQVAEHLRGLGHRRVAWVGLDRDQSWNTLRRQAFHRHFGEDAPALALASDVRDLDAQVDPFLHEQRGLTAVVAATDLIAQQVVRAANRRGLRVPAGLSVVGYGNARFDSDAGGITSVDQMPYSVGVIAAEAAMERGPVRRRRINTPCRLIVRDSTAQAG